MARKVPRPSRPLQAYRLQQARLVAYRTVFVEGALPGERVRVQLEEGKVLKGELVEVLEPSKARRAPPCPLADRCGGCTWLHLDEPAQRAAKEEIVCSTLEHLGGIARS